ncbi:MAG: lysylphosphatidylglycerol synthase transmembrane domain-containing protein [Pseudomonadota bacterium]
MKSRIVRVLVTSVVSLAAATLVLKAVNWREAIALFREGSELIWLLPFLIIAALIALVYGLRWRMLVGSCLGYRDTIIGTIMTLGGNMVLPVRGGDLLRVHHTKKSTKEPYANIVSALTTEKLVDLSSLCLLAIIAIPLAFYSSNHETVTDLNPIGLAVILAAVLTISIIGIATLRSYRSSILWALTAICRRLHLSWLLDAHLKPFLVRAYELFELRSIAGPVLISIILWLTLYAPSYLIIGQFVGIDMTYLEAMVVLIAGVISLAIPAAPSGLGTYHASVTSSFVLLGRPAAEGLLLATSIHLLFFVVYVAAASVVFIARNSRAATD